MEEATSTGEETGMFVIIAAAAAAFLLLPFALARTSPWIARHVVDGYGAQHLETGLLCWKLLLAVLIFAAVRTGLRLAFSAASLALAMRIIALMQRR
jgi:hypothetical protein